MALSFDQIKQELKKVLKKKRYEHVLRVNETALKINKDLNLNLDEDQIQYACLLHDCAKDNEADYFNEFKKKYDLKYNVIFKTPVVAHAFLGEVVAKEVYEVDDKNVLDAIKCHTTGKEDMSLLDKLLFISDYIEPNRDFENIDILRDKVYEDFDKSILLALDMQIKHLIDSNNTIDTETIKARNYLLKESK